MDDWIQAERDTLLAGVSASDAALLVAWATLWNEEDFDRLEESVDSDLWFNEIQSGPDGLRAMVANERSALGGFTLRPEKRSPSVTAHRFVIALDRHPQRRLPVDDRTIPATGRSFAIDGIEIYRIAHDRIAEGWAAWDMISMYRTFGAIATPTRDATT